MLGFEGGAFKANADDSVAFGVIEAEIVAEMFPEDLDVFVKIVAGTSKIEQYVKHLSIVGSEPYIVPEGAICLHKSGFRESKDSRRFPDIGPAEEQTIGIDIAGDPPGSSVFNGELKFILK